MLSLAGIQALVLCGRISEAVRVVRASYPGLLDSNPELLFRLKCRQFVEMIGGYDTTDLLTSSTHEPRLSCHSELSVSSGEVGSPPPPSSPPGDDGAFGGGEVNGECAMDVDTPATTEETAREQKGALSRMVGVNPALWSNAINLSKNVLVCVIHYIYSLVIVYTT